MPSNSGTIYTIIIVHVMCIIRDVRHNEDGKKIHVYW